MATVTSFHGQGGSIANQLLEDGKAAYGVPGPGAYLVPSSFRQSQREEHNAGSHVFGSAPSWTLKGRLVDTERSRSPGPVYDTAQGHLYLEKHGMHQKESTFGVGARDEPHRFYSLQHSQATLLCTGSPGPAAYKLKHGRRIPHTLGDAPTFKFGVRLKGNFDPSKPSNMSPGPDYNVPGSMGPQGGPLFKKAPRFSFGPGSLRQQARRQSKQEAIKVLWSRDQRKEEEKGSPGPGHYKPLNEPETAGTESVAYSFTHAATGRELALQQEQGQTLLRLPSMWHEAPCTRFARARSVPLMSYDTAKSLDYTRQLARVEEEARKGTQPSPAEYEVASHVQALSSHPKAPVASFGTQQRQCSASAASGLSLPGPGTYKTEECQSHSSRHANAPAFSLSPLHPPARPPSARPGPGQYKNPTDGELVQSNSRYLNSGAPSFCKGQATNRYSFIPKSDSPGPIYDTCKGLGKKHGPAFGDKATTPSPAHAQVVPDYFVGALGSLGQDSPGPNILIPQGKTSKLGQGSPWGKWKHGVKLPPRKRASAQAAIATASSMDASPGPVYNPLVSLANSKHAHTGSFSFGYGGRTPIHNVRF